MCFFCLPFCVASCQNQTSLLFLSRFLQHGYIFIVYCGRYCILLLLINNKNDDTFIHWSISTCDLYLDTVVTKEYVNKHNFARKKTRHAYLVFICIMIVIGRYDVCYETKAVTSCECTPAALAKVVESLCSTPKKSANEIHCQHISGGGKEGNS